MGWLFTHGLTREQLIQERTEKQENEAGIWEYPHYKVIANCLWKVCRFTNKKTGEIKLFIALDLIGSQKNYGYGYKDMDESMGPCYYTCPLSFFDIVPLPENSPYAQEWREAVKEYQQEQKRKRDLYNTLEIGKTYSLSRCSIPHITIIGKRKRTYIGNYQNKNYRVPRNLINAVINQ
jgi:hypothetical protein